MQICTTSRQLARQVDQHPVGAAHDAHQLSLCLYGAASNATPLGNVLHALNSFLGHLRNNSSPSPLQAWRTMRCPEVPGRMRALGLFVLGKVSIAALMLLAADDLTKFLVEH